MDFSSHPLGVPPSVKNADKIKDILKTSWETQKRLRVTNACLFVNVILRRCFKAMDIKTNVVYGILSRDKDFKLPHVWLDIQGHVVDNTFVEDIPEPILITMKGTGEYIATSVKEQEGLYLGDHVTRSHGVDDHDVTQFEWMLSNEDKSLALSKNKLQLGQLFKAMTNYMLIKYKVEVQPISETVVTNCWSCDRNDLTLKVCGDCKHAKYCSRECQKKDRKCHKLVCIQPNTY